MSRQTASSLTGFADLDRAMRSWRDSAANRVARAAVRKGAQAIAAQVKKEIPSRQKSARKAIGYKMAKAARGEGIAAKVGAAVGKKLGGDSDAARSRPGVGLSSRNIHWYILGTTDRRTKSGAYRGSTVGNPVVRRGVDQMVSKLPTLMRSAAQKQMQKELAKGKRVR